MEKTAIDEEQTIEETAAPEAEFDKAAAQEVAARVYNDLRMRMRMSFKSFNILIPKVTSTSGAV